MIDWRTPVGQSVPGSISGLHPHHLRRCGSRARFGRVDRSNPSQGRSEYHFQPPGSRVVFDDVIGDYVDTSGAAAPTRVGIIHYSSEGIHIVPARPQ